MRTFSNCSGRHVSFPLAMAALLHDVGKPRTVGRTADRYTFYGHEHVGTRMADEIARRLKLSNDERERIDWLVDKHQVLADARQMRPSKLKVLLAHPGIRRVAGTCTAPTRSRRATASTMSSIASSCSTCGRETC